MSHPKGYTKEMIKEMLGTAWLDKDNLPETGNVLRRRIGNEIRAGIRKKKPFPSAESRAKLPNFDENGKYIYPENAGFNYMDKVDPNSEWNCTGGKVS